MGATETRAVMEQYARAIVDRAEFDRFYSPDVTWTTMETGEHLRGRAQVRDSIIAVHTQAFDAHPEVVSMTIGEDTAVLEARFIGTHVGDFAGVPATGRRVDVPYCVVYDVADGMITALRAYLPVSQLRSQLVATSERASVSA